MPEFRNIALTVNQHLLLSRPDTTVTDTHLSGENGRTELSLNTESELNTAQLNLDSDNTS